MILRDYQKCAVDAILSSREGNHLVVLPTGSGKSLVISESAYRLGTKALILQPTKEILEQNVAKMLQYVPREKIGIYSASMDEKTIRNYTFATIQSIYKVPELFKDFGLVFVDEAHGVAPAKKKRIENLETKKTHFEIHHGMYTQFFKDIGNPKVFGTTATPYRLYSRSVPYFHHGHERNKSKQKMFTAITEIRLLTSLPQPFFRDIIYNLPMQGLIDQGYLIKPTYFDNSKFQHYEIPVNKSKSDFDLDAYEEMITPDEDRTLDTIVRLSAVSHSVLVFCTSVETATRYATVVKGSAVVSADTKSEEREHIISEFKEGKIKVVFNVSCLTTGFDHPALDGIVLLRPTRSISLWVQMLGRGLRTSPGKTTCRIVDFSGTYQTLGPVEEINVFGRDGWPVDIHARGKTWDKKELYRMNIEIQKHENN